MKELNTQVAQFKESIFSTMTKLANEHQAVNLSQGFPDFDGPSFVIEEAIKAMQNGFNQYAPSMGLLSLRESVAMVYEKNYQLKFNPLNQVLITNGATEALFCSIKALINPGDEVIVFEPFYDSYKASIEMAYGKVVPVTLKLPHFEFDLNELEQAINSKTKLIIFNNPHNPTGKVFRPEEILSLYELVKKHDLYLISDEVYEYLIFDQKHIPTASLFKDMSDRVLTISSTGKTFGLTGWKVGWVIGDEKLIKQIHNVHQFTCFSVATPLQKAMDEALKKIDDYIPVFQAEYLSKKQQMIQGLTKAGFDLYLPKGTYFVIAKLDKNLQQNDIQFCSQLIIEKKVATIPVSAFYLKRDEFGACEGDQLIRFCFAKKEATIKSAIQNLCS